MPDQILPDSGEREALRDLAGRAARHLRTLPEQTEGRDVALAAELEWAAAGRARWWTCHLR